MGDRSRLLLLAGGVASAALATAGLVAAAKHYGGEDASRGAVLSVIR
jgi:hypothetical protein